MGLTIPVAFTAAGSLTGFLIPKATQRLAQYKCSKKSTELIADKRYTSILLKTGLCILNALVWGLVGYREASSISALLSCFLFSTAIVIALIDFRIRIIPNELVLVMLAAGFLLHMLVPDFSEIILSVVSMVAMMIFFTAVTALIGFGKVGAGDVKLAGAMGLALGYPNILTALLIMSAALLLYCILGLVFRKISLQSMVPLAPFMMLGMTVSLCCGIFRPGVLFLGGLPF